MKYRTLHVEELDAAMRYRMVTTCVLPRPIAWIVSQNANGLPNVAPFSSYNYVAHAPPMVAINIASRDGKLKDTARNLIAIGEFTINVPTEATLRTMHQTSGEYEADISEAEVHGIAMLPSDLVKPKRIAIAPVQMECRLVKTIPLGLGVNTLYLADIVAFHLSEDIFDGRYVDVAKMRPITRLAGSNYATVGEVIHLEPVFTPPDAIKRENE